MNPIQSDRLIRRPRPSFIETDHDGPPDGVTPAWLTSLALHLSAIVLLAALTAEMPSLEEAIGLQSKRVDLLEEIAPEEFHFDNAPAEDVGALGVGGVQSPDASAIAEDDLSSIATPVEIAVDTGDIAMVTLEEPVSISPDTSDNLLVKGVGSVGVSGAAGAIDRITHELLRSMEQRPTIVVWLFDQSGSLQPQRQAIHNRLDRIYHELGVIEAAGNEAFSKHQDKPLLTAVMEFGERANFLIENPTDDVESIKEAIRNVTEDTTGHENVFQAIVVAASKYRTYRTRPENKRNVMFVVFSDESGDDTNYLDKAVNECRTHAIPVFVIGVPAPFGRQKTYMKYIDPDPNFDQSPQWATVDQGPESLMPERILLHFSGVDGRDERIDSGFGPFGLTRLCYQSGGVYFAIHPNRERGGYISRSETTDMSAHLARFFDPDVMRRYRPDYISVKEYNQLLRSNRARAALVEASNVSWTENLGDARTVFPRINEPQLVNALTLAQRDAAKVEPKIRKILQLLEVGERDREKLRKPRWTAGYDLAMGRTLAALVRAEGYNAMLAKAKQGMKFENEENDTWVLVPSDDATVSSVLEKQADKAMVYLSRVVEEHPGTPWRHLAERELQRPLGWRWSERYTGVNAPPPPMQMANNNPQRRDDQRRMLEPRKPKRPPPAL